MAGPGRQGGNAGDFRSAKVLIAGQGPLALPLTRLLAASGIQDFTLFSLAAPGDPTGEEGLIEAIRIHGQSASIHLVRASQLKGQAYLLPQNLDLLVDCQGPHEDHEALESACRAQGIPLVLAFASDSLFLTGLIDPYAGSMALLFGEKGIFREGSSGDTCGGEVDEAARAAAQRALEVLSGQASFSQSWLEVHDRVTCLSSQVPMPVSIPAYPRMVLVGADQRKLGKTSLCIKLAERLSARGKPVRILKVDNSGAEGPARLTRESRQEPKPAIQALFEAGSQEVWRLVVPENKLGQSLMDALAKIYETMDQRGILLCESNSARRFLQPGLFIQLQSSDGQTKASAVRTRRLADQVLMSPFTDEEVDQLVESIAEAKME